MSTSIKKIVYSPSQADVDAYVKFKSGENKQRAYMKDYKSLHNIEGLNDVSILVYEAVRNLVGMYVMQQNFIRKQKIKSVGTTRNTNKSIVGTTMIITNPMLQEWIGNKSHNTIKSALEQLEDFGFIKCSVDGVNKKSGRKITLLRDMEEYQPEEIQALENYLSGLENDKSVGSVETPNEEEKPKRKGSAKSENKKNDKKNNKKNEKQNEFDEDELDDFDF